MIIFFLLLVSILSIISIYQPLIFLILLALLWLLRRKIDFRLLLVTTISFMALAALMRFVQIALVNERLALVVTSKENYLIVRTLFSKYYINIKGNPYAVGDIIKINGLSNALSFNRIERGFDFKHYLNKQGVAFEIINYEIKTLFSFPIRPLEISKQLLVAYSDNAKVLIDALIFNNKDYQSIIISNFSSLHLLFLFSSSGIHIYFLFKLTNIISGLFLSKQNERDVLCLLLLFPLFLLNLNRFIFYRLFIVKAVMIYNRVKLNKKYDYITILSASALMFLLLNPFLIFNMSFYVSYGLSFYLYFLRPIIRRLKKSIRGIATFISIYIFLIPLRILTTNALMPLGIIVQFLVTPLISLYFVFAYIGVFIGGRGQVILNPLADLIAKISKGLSRFNLGIYASDIGTILLLVFIVLIVALIYALESKHRPLIRMCIISTLTLSFFVFVPYEQIYQQSVTFINVGQGDATLIIDRKTAILIDTGGSHYQDIAKEALIPFFRSKKIYDIDALIITHDDFDHNGAKQSLIDNFLVKRVVDQASAFPLRVGSITLDNLNDGSYHQEDNEKSLVIAFTLMNKKWLLMGDASTRNEMLIIKQHPTLRADYLKIGHHGSNTSSDITFLQHIRPKEAIISCGVNNFYGHPHHDVISNLEALDVVIRRTDIEGSIHYQSLAL